MVLAAAALSLPLTAQAGIADILSLFSAITGTLNHTIAPVLGDIQAIEARVGALEQQVVWPVALVAQAKASAQQIRARLSSLAAEIRAIPVSSATLAKPARLEALLRGQDVLGLNQISSPYRDIFLPLPAEAQATAWQRNLMDIDDALALAAMKTATVSDAASQSSLALADSLEQQAASSSPGTAPFLSAQAEVASLENQAMIEKMLAAELRQEAAGLAHQNALRKQSAASMEMLRNNLLRLLSRH